MSDTVAFPRTSKHDTTMKKTAGINALVRDVLEALPRPYTENVIEDVFLAVENEPALLARYETECDALTKTVANNWVGMYVGNILGKVGTRQVKSTRSKLAGSFSVLDTDARTVARKPKEDEARQLMSDYYMAHRHELPESVRQFREVIVELIMEGKSPVEAFSFVLKA